MKMEDQLSVYRVEISGWDVNEQFFVERAALQWGQGEQRTVLVRRRVREGALVFVRLLQDTPPRSFPVAYRARQIHHREGKDYYELTLTQVWPAEQNSSSEAPGVFDTAQDRALGMN
jgi:hypothetical protein